MILSGDGGWQVRGVDVGEKGFQKGPCGTPFLMRRNLLRLALAVMR